MGYIKGYFFFFGGGGNALISQVATWKAPSTPTQCTHCPTRQGDAGCPDPNLPGAPWLHKRLRKSSHRKDSMGWGLHTYAYIYIYTYIHIYIYMHTTARKPQSHKRNSHNPQSHSRTIPQSRNPMVGLRDCGIVGQDRGTVGS